MKRSNQLPDGFCFPLPPGRIDHTLERTPFRAPVAALYLEEIRRWRDTVADAITSRDPRIAGVENLTPRARARLAAILSHDRDTRTRLWALGYGLVPFPPGGLHRDEPMKAVLDALRWRAAVVQYLTDTWDHPGKRDLKMQECVAIGMFMRPVRLEGRCIYCLTEYGPNHLAPEDHACVMAAYVQPAG